MENDSNFNTKRSDRISKLKRKNLKLVNQVKSQIKNMNLGELEHDRLLQFEKSITQCANISLYETPAPNFYKYIASHVCDHKLCFVCNYIRQKKIRRKYMRWFQDNDKFNVIEDTKGNRKLLTHYQLKKWIEKNGETDVIKQVKYDIMFLTLTVPHNGGTFRGEKFYQRALRALFNKLRKTDGWSDMVFGGEFGIEITRNDHGYHIHIHSLLFVRIYRQNRNHLHKFILLEWNRLTVQGKEFVPLKPEAISGLLKSNKLLTRAEAMSLNAAGATVINMNTIYEWRNGQKDRVTEYGGKNMMIAVMEAISYHFHPTAFDKEKNEFDLPLLIELLPHIFNLRIYDRFGVLYNETPLSMNDNTYLEDLEGVLELGLDDDGTTNGGQGNYFVTNPAYVWHDSQNNNRIVMSHKAMLVRIDLSAGTTGLALDEMGSMVRQMHKGKLNLN